MFKRLPTKSAPPKKLPIFKAVEGDMSKAEVPTEVHVVRTRSLGATAMQRQRNVPGVSKLFEHWSKSEFSENSFKSEG